MAQTLNEIVLLNVYNIIDIYIPTSMYNNRIVVIILKYLNLKNLPSPTETSSYILSGQAPSMLSRRHLLTSWLANQNKGQSLSATYIRNVLKI